MDLALFAITLLSGIIIGKRKLLPERIIDKSDKLLNIVIYTLILLIGIEIGNYREVLTSLGNIGIKSVTIALLSTILSAHFTKMLYERRKRN